ncbi:MAG: cupin domain-containing protein [Geminicoccaceae bacterium]
MQLNADFDRRAVVHAGRIDWVPSPMAGVSRRMLDRIGDEVARATSIVRFDAGSAFSPHVHEGGEEFLVLEGVFQDEHGDFPAGSYIRNPPGTSHTPASAPGCTILVKLWQFDADDRREVKLHVDDIEPVAETGREGVHVRLLFEDERERVRVESLDGDAATVLGDDGGCEIFVIDGSFAEKGEIFERHSWLRLPGGEKAAIRAGSEGARLWIKTGHLRHVRIPGSSA